MNKERISMILKLLAEVASLLAGKLGSAADVPEEHLDRAAQGLTTARDALRHDEAKEAP